MERKFRHKQDFWGDRECLERLNQNKIDNAIESIPDRIMDWISKERVDTGN